MAANREDPLTDHRLPVAVMVSGQGRGTNLQALLDGASRETASFRVAVVIGTRADAPALERARIANVPVSVVSPRKYENDESGYAATLQKIFHRHNVRLICLAGYMRKLPSTLLTALPAMNVHPALLPLFGGQGMYGHHVQEAVLAHGVKITGCTVHFVDEQYDTGPIIVQLAVPVEEDDTPDTLAARVLTAEHRAYVQAVELFAQNRLRVEGRVCRILPDTVSDEV